MPCEEEEEGIHSALASGFIADEEDGEGPRSAQVQVQPCAMSKRRTSVLEMEARTEVPDDEEETRACGGVRWRGGRVVWSLKVSVQLQGLAKGDFGDELPAHECRTPPVRHARPLPKRRRATLVHHYHTAPTLALPHPAA